MKLLVPVKQVPNPAHPVRLSRGANTAPELDDIPLVINPFDEIALEEAVRLRESGVATEVVALCIGPEAWEAEMRTALALGADRGVRITAESPPSPLCIARCIAAFSKQEAVEMILCGRQGVDLDRGMVGPMSAALLGWGQATFVSRLHITDGKAEVTREVDGGTEELALPLPAVITVDLRLNTPRYASLPNIMKARQKPLQRLTMADLGVDMELAFAPIGYSLPPIRPPVVRLENVAQLADILKDRGFVP